MLSNRKAARTLSGIWKYLKTLLKDYWQLSFLNSEVAIHSFLMLFITLLITILYSCRMLQNPWTRCILLGISGLSKTRPKKKQSIEKLRSLQWDKNQTSKITTSDYSFSYACLHKKTGYFWFTRLIYRLNEMPDLSSVLNKSIFPLTCRKVDSTQ